MSTARSPMTPPALRATSPASLGRKARGFLIGFALAATSVAAGALTLDRLFPPDLSRYNDRSTEVVDSGGRHLRAFISQSVSWRTLSRLP